MERATTTRPRPPAVGLLGALVLVQVGAACAPRLSGDQLNYDSGVVLADADESEDGTADAGFRNPDATTYPDALTDAAPSRITTWVDDVQPIVAAHCQSCHGLVPANGATLPLSTYEAVTLEVQSARTGQRDYAYALMSAVVTSPAAPMPPGYVNDPLSAVQIDAIRVWAAYGAPRDGDAGVSPPDARAPDAEPVFPDATFPDAALPDAAAPDAFVPTNPLIGVGPVEVVQGGFAFLEGPLWIPADNTLLFSDVVTGIIHRYTPPNTITEFRNPSFVGNGLALDTQGRLYAAEHGSRSVTRGPTAGGPSTTLVGQYRGITLNSPNDVTVRADGVVYFTDPPYGLAGRPQEMPFNGLFRYVETATGTYNLYAEWEGNMAARPNGVILTADERTLFMANTSASQIMRFDVDAATGALSNPRVFVTTAQEPDGMAIDREQNLFVSTSAGIQAYAPTGMLWGNIGVPNPPANIAWGDADRRTLYITAYGTLYRVRMTIPGVRD